MKVPRFARDALPIAGIVILSERQKKLVIVDGHLDHRERSSTNSEFTKAGTSLYFTT